MFGPTLLKRTTAEFVGTCFLVAGVVGSGIMAERLAGGSFALALLANTKAPPGAHLHQQREPESAAYRDSASKKNRPLSNMQYPE